MNQLYYGDCLTIMQEMPLGSVDLIYLDPPFNAQRDYNAIYKTESGQPLPDQVEAFCDTWTLDEETERTIKHMPVLMRDNGIDDAEFWRIWLNALRKTNPKILAYLTYMTQRMLPMRGILKPTGSIYLHCDDEAIHYIKVMMDGIFGHSNFRDKIVWQRAAGRAKGSQHAARTFGRDVDYILHYSRGKDYKHNPRSTLKHPCPVSRVFRPFFRRSAEVSHRFSTFFPQTAAVMASPQAAPRTSHARRAAARWRESPASASPRPARPYGPCRRP